MMGDDFLSFLSPAILSGPFLLWFFLRVHDLLLLMTARLPVFCHLMYVSGYHISLLEQGLLYPGDLYSMLRVLLA
jgi:hypothetical protein